MNRLQAQPVCLCMCIKPTVYLSSIRHEQSKYYILRTLITLTPSVMRQSRVNFYVYTQSLLFINVKNFVFEINLPLLMVTYSLYYLLYFVTHVVHQLPTVRTKKFKFQSYYTYIVFKINSSSHETFLPIIAIFGHIINIFLMCTLQTKVK